MFNKLKEGFFNLKVNLIYFLMRSFIQKGNRKLFLKWIELKEELIDEYDFNMWVTRNVLDSDIDEGGEDGN